MFQPTDQTDQISLIILQKTAKIWFSLIKKSCLRLKKTSVKCELTLNADIRTNYNATDRHQLIEILETHSEKSLI